MACAACGQLCAAAVVAAGCGHSFCAGCVPDSACPVDGAQIGATLPNLALQQHLRSLPASCRHCRAALPRRLLPQHEARCAARRVACPNTGCARGQRRMAAAELSRHIGVCAAAQCANHVFGCAVKGTMQAVAAHARECRLGGGQDGADGTPIEARMLQRTLELQGELKRLSAEAAQLAKAIDAHSQRKQQQQSHAEPPSTTLPADFVMPFSFRCLGSFRGHEGPVWALASHGTLLFSSSSDETVKIWDTVRPSCVRTLPCARGVVHALAVTDTHLISGDSQGWIHSFRLDTFQVDVQRRLQPEVTVDQALISALVYVDGSLAAATYDCIQLLDPTTLKTRHSQQGLGHWVRDMCVGPDGALYTASGRRITVWSTRDLQQLRVLDTTAGAIRALTVTRKYIITGTHNQNIHGYTIDTLEHAFKLTGHVSVVTSLIASPGGSYLFSASADRSIQIWDLQKQLGVQSLLRHQDSVHTLKWHGELLVSGGADGDINVYRQTNQSPLPADVNYG